LIDVAKKRSFWAWARCSHSLPRHAQGCKKYRAKYDLLFGLKKFIRYRRYVGPGGEVRRTVEIEI
jgi:hypothetical protein